MLRGLASRGFMPEGLRPARFTERTMMLNEDKTCVTYSQETLRHYQERADAFRAGTQGHDVSQNIAAAGQHPRVPRLHPGFRQDPGDTCALLPLPAPGRGPEAGPHGKPAWRAIGLQVWKRHFLALDLPAAYTS